MPYSIISHKRIRKNCISVQYQEWSTCTCQSARRATLIWTEDELTEEQIKQELFKQSFNARKS